MENNINYEKENCKSLMDIAYSISSIKRYILIFLIIFLFITIYKTLEIIEIKENINKIIEKINIDIPYSNPITR